ASYSRCLSCCLFFFQAEDGIRDATVTGVQTCALPIFPLSVASTPLVSQPGNYQLELHVNEREIARMQFRMVSEAEIVEQIEVAEIGRASCRERVWVWVWDGAVKEEENMEGVDRRACRW